MQKVKKGQFFEGIKASAPAMLGYLSVGAAFGIIASSQGFSLWEIFLLSSVFYAGSAQFVFISMWESHAAIQSIVVMVFLINFRMFLQSLTVSQTLKKQPLISRILMGSLVTDESFGIFSLNKVANKKISVSWMHGLNIAAWVSWWLSSVVFGFIGQNISSPEKFGLDFSLTAMFAGLWLLTYLSMLEDPRENKRIITFTVISTIILLYLLLYITTMVIAVLVASIIGSILTTLLTLRGNNYD